MEHPNPCVKCECVGLVGSTGMCYTNEDHAMMIKNGKVSFHHNVIFTKAVLVI